MLLNPALSWLLRAQARAKLRRWSRRFRSRRKLLLSLVALVLALVWLGNAAISILLREPYSIQTLRNWIPIVLLAYSLWHVLKVAWKRPEAPIEWSPAEQALICEGPFTRQQVLAYRLATVIKATLLKALCAALLLLPDFPVWPAGFLGIVLALVLLELLRMALEISAFGASPRAFLLFRIGVFGTASAIAVRAWVMATSTPLTIVEAAPESTAHLFGNVLLSASELAHSSVGTLLAAPFVTFAHVITAPRLLGVEFAGPFFLSLLLVVVLARFVFWLDRVSFTSVLRAERTRYHRRRSSNDTIRSATSLRKTTLPRIPSLGGIGPFVWRQMIGAFGHRFGLVAAFVPPTVLALLPLSLPLSPLATFLQVVGGLVFYSFLLLPAALKFDFRRDYDRLYLLKMLPASPSAIVLGQIATPILLTSVFQLGVLAVTVLIRPVAVGYVTAAIALLLPLNVLIFSAENLLFLLSPYRPRQEGIDIFLRTILVFTAKGIFFTLALAFFFAWSHVARILTELIGDRLDVAVSFSLLFTLGLEIVVGLATIVFIKLLVQAYRRYDPSLDAAG